MANHLRICIVGGRSFGKTALVKAVAHIPCFVARNYKGAADRLEKMPFDDPKWTQTKWEDVKDWQFKFTVEEDGKTKDKILSFADYAGEYFEEDYEDSSTGTEGKSPTGTEGNKVEETKVQKLLRNLWPWSGKKKAKRQINKLLYHPDGIIILLPRDFGSKKDGKDIYERSLYEKRVLEYLEKVRPGTPVQIVISKWDLNDEQEPQGASAVEIMSSPVFKTCYERILNGYRSCNGVEYNAGIIGISTKDLHDGEWIDETDIAKYKEAYNVRELFTKLSHAADVARTERLKTDWASAKWWKRWFVMPWRSLDVRRKNSDDKEVNGILARAWLRFLGFVAAAAIITCISIVAVVGLTERFRLDGIESDIAAASTRLDKVTKENLVEMDYQLGTNKWIHPIFFLPRLSELKGKLNELNTKYVAFLEEELDGKLKAPRVKVGSPWEVSSDVRLGVASNRLDIVKEQNKKLPVGMSSDAISQRLKTDEAVLVNLNRDVEFDKALYGLSKMGESQKLRGMDDIRIRFQYMKSYRTNDFLRLDSDIASLEKEQSTTLSNTLAQLEKEYPAGDLSVRRTLAQQKIDAINNALTNVFILGSVPHKEWSKQLEVVKSDKATDERYDPFDREYEQLGKNDLKAIAAFKEKHTVKEFPNRKDKLADLDRREAALIKQIMEGVKQNEKKFAYDDKDKSFKWRIGQAANLTNVYSVALGKLRKSDDEYTQIDKKHQSTMDWISGHVKYIEVENAWVSAMNAPETNRVQAIVKVLRTYDKDTYPEYTNRMAEAQAESERLSSRFVLNCTNEIAVLRKNQGDGTWQAKVKDAQERIKKIQDVLPSVLDSDRQALEILIKRESEEIASLSHTGNHYDPFDKAYAELDTSDLKAIATFKANYSREIYPEREEKFKTLAQKERTLIQQLMEGVNQKEKKFACDDKGKSFKLRIEQATSLTNAYSVALGKLRRSDDEYTQIDKKRQSTADWISGHVKYMEVENVFSSAMNAPETNRVQAIVKVLTKYDNDLYSEASNLFAVARTEAERLSTRFVQICTNEISVARKNQKGSWKSKKTDAQERIKKIQGTLLSVLAKDKSILEGLIKEEEKYITRQEKEGRFIDRYETLIQMPQGKDLLGAITNFRKDFKENEYPTHTNDYVSLNALEKGVLDQIEVAFTNELSHISNNVAVTNFLARQDRSLKIKEASERALESIPEDHPAAQKYRAIRDTAERDVKKFAKWVEMRETAKRLILFAEAAERKDGEEKQQAQKLVISRVGGFYEKYPEIENPDGELHEIYVTIKNSLTKAEVAIQEKYQEMDDVYVSRADEATGEDEKIELVNRRIALIDEYLPAFLHNSNPHSALIHKRDGLSRVLDANERDKLFKGDHAECIRKLESKISTSEKIDVIEQFVAKYNSDVWLSKPNVKTEIVSMEGKKDRLKFQKQFEEFEAERSELFANRPAKDEDDSEKLVGYKDQCEKLREKFTAIKRHGNIQNKVEQSIAELDKQIKWVDGRLGDGTWSDIKKKKSTYAKNPSQANYATLIDALIAFNPLKEGNSDYKKKVDDLKSAVEDDWNFAAKVDVEWEKFGKDPNRENYKAFVRAYSELSSKESDLQQQGVSVKIKKAKAKYSGVANMGILEQKGLILQPKIELVELSFRGTVFSHPRRNSHIHLKYDVGAGPKLFLEADNMPDFWDSSKACGTITGGFSREIPIGEYGITFSILNETGTDETGQTNIPIWEILADGVKFNGAYPYPVKIYARKTNPAILTFKFSGLPTLKER